MYKFTIIDKMSLIIILISALNQGIYGVLNFNFIEVIFGSTNLIGRIIYIIIGVASIDMILFLVKTREIYNPHK